MTVDRGSWGYRRNVDIKSYLAITELLYELASTVRWLPSLDFVRTFFIKPRGPFLESPGNFSGP